MQLSRRQKKIALGSLLLLVALATAWYGFRSYRQRANLARIREQLATANLSPEQRRAVMESVRQLAPEQRRALFEDRRRAFDDRLKKYFELPKKQRVAFLDGEIKRMETMRQQMQRGGGPGGAGGPGAGGPGGGRRGASADDRDRRRRERLDQGTPEERAQRSEFFRELNQRRQQLGLGSFGPGRGPR